MAPPTECTCSVPGQTWLAELTPVCTDPSAAAPTGLAQMAYAVTCQLPE
ncbi:hypothetical protein [Micromonospora sp. NPDC049799]